MRPLSRLVFVIAVLAAALSGLGAGIGRAGAQPGTVGHRPPVDAPVVDPFRPPPGPYGPGNRGLEYAVATGTAVRASASGTVTFAGWVAGIRYVTLLHDDGIRTTYGQLSSIAVAVGDTADQGDVVGRSGDRLHFSARRDGAYLDPASLFGRSVIRVRLVPHDVAAPWPQPAAAAATTDGSADRRPLAVDGGSLRTCPSATVAATAPDPRGRPPTGARARCAIGGGGHYTARWPERAHRRARVREPHTYHATRTAPRSPTASGPGQANRWEGTTTWQS